MKTLNPQIAIGFLTATVFWIGVLGWQASYAPTEIEKQKCYDAAHKSGHKSEECKTFWDKATTDPVAFFTLVLAVSTIGLWGATIFLYRAGEKQIAVAGRAADAAAASVDAAETAFNKLERPYIFISQADRFFHDDARAPMGIASVKYEVGNHGKTPAIIENVRAVISSGTVPDIPIRVDDQHALFVCRVVPPQYLYHPIEDAPDDIDFVTSGDEIVPQLRVGEDVFLWIVISYRGAFTKGHETSACWRYDGLTNRLVQWGHDDYNYVK
jgi:hypothetical protein